MGTLDPMSTTGSTDKPIVPPMGANESLAPLDPLDPLDPSGPMGLTTIEPPMGPIVPTGAIGYNGPSGPIRQAQPMGKRFREFLKSQTPRHRRGATPKYGRRKWSYLKMGQNRDCGCSTDSSRSKYQGSLFFEIG